MARTNLTFATMRYKPLWLGNRSGEEFRALLIAKSKIWAQSYKIISNWQRKTLNSARQVSIFALKRKRSKYIEENRVIKMGGQYCYSSPHIETLALPCDRATQKASHWIWRTNISAGHIKHRKSMTVYKTPNWSAPVALFMTNSCEFTKKRHLTNQIYQSAIIDMWYYI